MEIVILTQYYPPKKGTSHALAIGRQTVGLPITAKLTEEDVDDVIGAVRALVRA
jgi:dTDP-4-amino-4,6-dideoxygalactose transaminase